VPLDCRPNKGKEGERDPRDGEKERERERTTVQWKQEAREKFN